jgi:hypothetical protein
MLWVVLTETKLETLWQVNKNVRTHLLPKKTTPSLLLISRGKKKIAREGHKEILPSPLLDLLMNILVQRRENEKIKEKR